MSTLPTVAFGNVFQAERCPSHRTASPAPLAGALGFTNGVDAGR
jgi:hypothetical protein